MYCTRCGLTLQETDNYCHQCGTSTGRVPYRPGPNRPLMRSRSNRKIAGVCGGLAEYLGVDATLVRLIFILVAVLPIPGALITYIVAWIVMPLEPLGTEAPAASTAQPVGA